MSGDPHDFWVRYCRVREDRRDFEDSRFDGVRGAAKQATVVMIGHWCREPPVQAIRKGPLHVGLRLHDSSLRQVRVEPGPSRDLIPKGCTLQSVLRRIPAYLHKRVSDCDLAKNQTNARRGGESPVPGEGASTRGRKCPGECRDLRKQHYAPAEIIVKDRRSQE